VISGGGAAGGGPPSRFLECVANVSEGRDSSLLSELAAVCGRALLDLHSDPHHNRSVFTLAGPDGLAEESARALAVAVVERLDLSSHAGVHPRIGAVDVVPFVNLAVSGGDLVDGDDEPAIEARNRFAEWAAEELGLPCFLYGRERTLPVLRRSVWHALRPQFGPDAPHPTAGAVAVGARHVLVAYNLWLGKRDPALARRVAEGLRGPEVRSLAFEVGDAVQVSCNLIDPWIVGPGAVFDAVASQASVERAELVGLIPRGVLLAEPPQRWAELDLDPSRTIEARLQLAGLDGGSFDLHGSAPRSGP
jgi:glutamate formiminotransferase